MQTMIAFMRIMFANGGPLATWIGALLAVNLVGPLLYLHTTEARVVLLAFLLGATAQLLIFQRLGFVRLLGLGHVAWLPMLVWLLTRPTTIPTGDGFTLWLWAVILLDSVSLIIDAADVVRYARGERAPHLAAG